MLLAPSLASRGQGQAEAPTGRRLSLLWVCFHALCRIFCMYLGFLVFKKLFI